jgi:thioredoxin-related protein|tara:strand:+ start:1415 stop:1831 length:417 start_codon:yes stop_codon:yes gene_type:complete
MISRVIQKHKPKEAIFKSLVQDYFKENPLTEEAVVTIKKSTRSDAQNRLYFHWVSILAKEIGYSKEEMHLILADKFLPKIEFTTKKGKQISQIPSTTGLDIEEFIDYICEIEMFSGEWGIKLPHNQDYKIAVYNEYTT